MAEAATDAVSAEEARHRARTSSDVDGALTHIPDSTTTASAGGPAHGLLDRIRASLTVGHVREVRMFGAIAVMVDDAMAVAVRKDGSLLVRVDPAEDPRLLGCPGASRAEMSAGRSMGDGWIRVEASALQSDESLGSWLEAAARWLARRSQPTS